ncbi:MAG: S41 family peptidase [Candidatus Eisenbacteria bacterium]|nr:S41 family peptidase [Candidatus Eisenbacteria bacterium]
MSLSLLLGFGLARAISAGDDLRSNLDLFSNVLYLVQNNYVEAPDNEKLIKGAIDGMLKTLDPHSVFLPEKRAQVMDEQFHGEYSGIGVQFDLQENKIVVISPLEGTPAYRLGIRAGDKIIEIDDKPLKKNINNEDVFKLLRGPNGSTVSVTIEREAQEEHLHFTIERAKIPIESIPYAYMIRPGVGYVRIIRFAQTTGDELESSIAKLRGQGMKSLLIDLRSNSGGLLSQAVDVLDQIVPDNKRLVYTRGRITSSNADYYSTNRPGKWTDGAIVVLVDHGSASASEIVGGAVQDLDRGLVVGINTFGKGLVQNQMNLSQGKLLLTIARYYTPSGRGIQRDYTKFGDQSEYQEDAYREDVPSDSALQARPKFKTATGRIVYGGGGIYPDVIIKDPPFLTRPEVELITKRVAFEFATHYVTRHPGTTWKPESFDQRFQLTPDEWTNLRTIATNKKIVLNDSTWTAEKPFLMRQVRAELASATLGSVERYRIAVEDDAQLNAALDMFPRAQKLMAAGAGARSEPGPVDPPAKDPRKSAAADEKERRK